MSLTPTSYQEILSPQQMHHFVRPECAVQRTFLRGSPFLARTSFVFHMPLEHSWWFVSESEHNISKLFNPTSTVFSKFCCFPSPIVRCRQWPSQTLPSSQFRTSYIKYQGLFHHTMVTGKISWCRCEKEQMGNVRSERDELGTTHLCTYSPINHVHCWNFQPSFSWISAEITHQCSPDYRGRLSTE